MDFLSSNGEVGGVDVDVHAGHCIAMRALSPAPEPSLRCVGMSFIPLLRQPDLMRCLFA